MRIGTRLLGALALIFFILPAASHATSGACSYHGGVNCAAGSDWDGSVICNDGWTDSSVSYSSMLECQSYGSYYSTPSCPFNSSYDSASGSCKCYSGYVVSGNSCVSGDSYCWSNYGYGSTYNSLTKDCACSSGYVMSGGQCVSQTQYCISTLGLMSTYDSLTETCKCMAGYDFNGVSCVYRDTYAPTYSSPTYSAPTYPANTCPQNSSPSFVDSSQCSCNAGYQANAAMTACEAIPAATASQTSTLTDTQINSILNLLRAFGADAGTIANVAVILEK